MQNANYLKPNFNHYGRKGNLFKEVSKFRKGNLFKEVWGINMPTHYTRSISKMIWKKRLLNKASYAKE